MSSEPSRSTLKLWRCGDDYKPSLPLPEKDADNWNNLLAPLMKRDKEQCDAWKEEIQNLLIFAGLFSAVATAFVIILYQGLQPDSNQMIIALLTQIATTLDNFQNATSPAEDPISLLGPDSNALPSSAMFRVNILWSASLVLSLTAALGGIVGLQWLREYQRSPPRGTSQESFAYFNMRSNGLKEWYVPQIFSALPVLLLLALVLFLIGLIDFLPLNAPRKVFAPMIAIISLPIIFIVLTTILPSFEWVLPPTIFFKVIRRIPAQCPYKSPQSFRLREILSPILSFLLSFIIGLLKSHGIESGANDDNEPGANDDKETGANAYWNALLSTFPRDPHHRSDMIALYYREICHEELYREKKEAQSLIWENSQLFRMKAERRTVVPFWYDLIEGLKTADRKGSRDPPVQAACYQCVQELATLSNQMVFTHEEDCHRYIQSILQKDWPNCEPHFSLDNFTRSDTRCQGSEVSRANDRDALREETRVAALRAFTWDVSTRYIHGHELHIRLMHYYFRRMPMGLGITLTKATRNRLLSFWRNTSPVDHNRDFSKQYTSLLHLLFTRGAVSTQTQATPLIYLPHPHLAQFVETACWSQQEEDTLLTVKIIQNQANKYSPEHITPSDHLLLVLMASYIDSVIDKTKILQKSQANEPTPGAGYMGLLNLWEDSGFMLNKLIAKRTWTTSQDDLLIRGSVLCSELNGYILLINPGHPTAAASTTIRPTNPSPGPPSTINRLAASRRRLVPEMISVQTSNQLEVMFPGERIAPPPQLQYLWQNTPNFMPTQHSQPGPGDHSRTPSLRQHIRRTPNLRRHTL